MQGLTGPSGAPGIEYAYCELLQPFNQKEKPNKKQHQDLPVVTFPLNPINSTATSNAQNISVGCFYQSGASSSTVGKVLSTFQQTYTIGGNTNCSKTCNSQNYNFYGVVNTPTTTVDCYCGDTLNFISIANLGTGAAPDNNCVLCVGGPAPAGECGVELSSVVAIFARAF